MLGSGPGRNPAEASSVCTEKKEEKKRRDNEEGGNRYGV